MDVHFETVPFAEIADVVRAHYAALPSPIDSFLEDHILASTHYRIKSGRDAAGFASVHDGKLITQFALVETFRHLGQLVFARLRRTEQVQSAFVPTCDEFYLAHALDEFRSLTKQAYFFATGGGRQVSFPEEFTLRLAEPGDADRVRHESGSFFENVEGHIARQELFITLHRGEIVGFGLSIRSTLSDHMASIGMFTIELYRRSGIGSATIALLIEDCQRRGLRPVAGCWYYNHASKRTLERAGMYAGTRLLKVEY